MLSCKQIKKCHRSIFTTNNLKTNSNMSIQFDKNSSKSQRFVFLSNSIPFSMKKSSRERLTPFGKLPSIGHSNEYTPRPPPTQKTSSTNPRNKIYQQQEPILIAIKLADGRRLQRMFYPTNTIKDIVNYVKSQEIHSNEQFYLSSGDVPKRQFQDLNLTISQAKIQTRTVLFIDRV